MRAYVSDIDRPNVILKYRSPSLVLVAGCPGAGKTTLIERAIPSNGFLLSADAYRGRQQVLAGYRWEAYIKDAIPEARRKFMSDLDLLLSHKVSVFCDASYLTEKSQNEMIDHASAQGVPTNLLVVTASLQECLDGVSNRERTVPKDKVQGFYADYLEMLDRVQHDDWDPMERLDSIIFVSRRASESLTIDLGSPFLGMLHQ